LQELDLTFNQRLFMQDTHDLLQKTLPTVAVRMTVTSRADSLQPCDRDATLLRSQLEPFTTLQLRRRLVDVFGQDPQTDVDMPPAPRMEVMEQLLECYAKAGVNPEAPRKLVRINGAPVHPDMCAKLMVELRDWSARYEKLQERPMIKAEKYMIIRSPPEFEAKIQGGSSKALRAEKKYVENQKLWKAAAAAMATVDPDFAVQFTGLAVTQGFRGSPHIDTTNIGPFYGLSLGDFADGEGGVQVEYDSMTVAEVNTKNRLGKVDGRFPHWVAPYDESCERFSLIYYVTEGAVTPKTVAAFGAVLVDGVEFHLH
jgi:hypothetical protein